MKLVLKMSPLTYFIIGAALVLFVFSEAFWNWRIHSTIKEFSKEHNVKYQLARDIAFAESSLNPFVVSKDGGTGLYQFMPKTWAWATAKLYGRPVSFSEARNLKINAEVGLWYISWIQKTLKQEGHYSEAGVVYCFNHGIGNFRERGYKVPEGHRNGVYNKYFKKYHKIHS
jgi:soluble lytic murein transglycosylase